LALQIGYQLDMIIRAVKKVDIHKRFWLSTLVFFRLARRTNILKGRIATRRAPQRGFLFSQGGERAKPGDEEISAEELMVISSYERSTARASPIRLLACPVVIPKPTANPVALPLVADGRPFPSCSAAQARLR
jgi:hypothetical protein